ncbi:MAG: peptidylprolyl isomerase [Gammaproteobacteria bacterium]|nr:peptidylprolyl isomerase [Gammaproteobacteria bacterium]MDH3448044.1 peptidylprolyl isomerase [Gammaproteobacteria bacterium]
MKIYRLTFLLLGSLLTALPAAAVQTPLDSIVAIVDESVITRRELEYRIRLVVIDFNSGNRRLPSDDVLRRQVLEAMISDSLLLQEANRRGIKITDSQLNQTMQSIARQNNLSLSDYRKLLIADGLDYDRYRETVRRELAITTLQRQYSQRNASVSDSEVDDFIERSDDDGANFEYRLSHILIALPDAASPEQVDAANQVANEILARLDLGEEFDQLANTYSAGDTALQGGDLGWRKKAEIPSLFTEQVLAMEPGGHAGPIRSASGFHIVHLKERRDVEQVISEQTRSRHILIRPNELISEEDARDRLLEFRERILAGEDFARLARLYSVDYASGSEGGDIGWMDPGSTVKEYEEVASRLAPGQISEPFRSQFGWHIVEVTGRRTVDETAQNKRKKIYSQLLEQKQREVFDLWKRRLRDEAYVVFPDKPDA